MTTFEGDRSGGGKLVGWDLVDTILESTSRAQGYDDVTRVAAARSNAWLMLADQGLLLLASFDGCGKVSQQVPSNE